MINKIFNAFFKFAKKEGYKIIYGSEGVNEYPYVIPKEKVFHFVDKEQNVFRLRELIHEWCHSTGPITNRPVFEDYPLEELVAEKTAYDIMMKYGFYSVFNRKVYVFKFKHASYINFWLNQAQQEYPEKSVDEILDMVNGHIEIATNMISEIIEKGDN